jgi:hypothetical protein
MKIAELVSNDPLRAELERSKKAQQALMVRKAQIKSQVAQQQLRAAKAPTKP